LSGDENIFEIQDFKVADVREAWDGFDLDSSENVEIDLAHVEPTHLIPEMEGPFPISEPEVDLEGPSGETPIEPTLSSEIDFEP